MIVFHKADGDWHPKKGNNIVPECYLCWWHFPCIPTSLILLRFEAEISIMKNASGGWLEYRVAEKVVGNRLAGRGRNLGCREPPLFEDDVLVVQYSLHVSSFFSRN